MSEIQPVASSFLLHDLHSHTTASDGLFSPTALVQRAVEKRVGVLAITDHDTVAGLNEAKQAITRLQLPLQLIKGVEISTLWLNHEIHILGLGITTEAPVLTQLLELQSVRRTVRAQEIAHRLAKHHVPNALEGAQRLAGKAMITRGHFARYLIEIGKENSMTQVFKRYLSKGNIGYVPPNWCAIDEAITAIQSAGGQAILAHPARYGLSAKWLRRLLVDFGQAGGNGMEVAQCQQARDERVQLARYADEYQLLSSQGSDFHQPCAWLELGRNLWLPANTVPVWQQW